MNADPTFVFVLLILAIAIGLGTRAIFSGWHGRHQRAAQHPTPGHQAQDERIPLHAGLVKRLEELDRETDALFDGNRYVRHSAADGLRRRIAAAIKEAKAVRGLPPPHERDLVAKLARLASAVGIEIRRERANLRYVAGAVASVNASCRALKLSPTTEQAEAIATDEEVTLVLAGAGTGKTAVVTGKVAHLVRDLGVRPDEVLVLAFNRAAADQIAERLPISMAADASTFHRFGNRVLGRTKPVSKLAEDDSQRRLFITQQLEEMLQDAVLARPVLEFMTSHLHPYRSPFDFDTAQEYESYVRGVELRALSGDRVRSFEELAIANFLTLNGVAFRYERAYPHSNLIYRPDFYVPLPHSEGVYVEHLALSHDGSAPWGGYAENVEWKRDMHRKHNTTLIESYSWQHSEGVLLPKLRARLEARGIKFQPLRSEVVIRQLRDEFLTSRLAYLIDSFLAHVRSSRLDAHELRHRATDSADPNRSTTFVELFDEVQRRYDERLSRSGEIDFHDQIHGATDRIRDGRWQSPYRYVLVDEFQDISAERMNLLASLRGPGTAFFLVGDDWQSIYRFTGSDVGLVRDSGKHLGHVRERALTQTFRFGPGVSEPSTAFIRRNPAQTQRNLRPAGHPPPVGTVTVIKAGSPAVGLRQALREIATLSARDPRAPSVLVLGRYRDSRKVLLDTSVPSWLSGRVQFRTVHSAKGLEADCVIVLDLIDKRRGFPSRVEDDPLLDLVAPPTELFLYAEERRVFYVALTRGRRGAWLIADAKRPSAFVDELLSEQSRNSPHRVRAISTQAADDPGDFDDYYPDVVWPI